MEFSLSELGLVDAPPTPEYDNLTKLASQLLDAPVSLVSVVDFENDRQFFKSHLGLAEPWATRQETPLSHSFCQHVVRKGSALVVSNAPEHPLVKDNLAIPDLGVIAYLGVPFHTPDNQPAGALCVIQGEPRAWTEKEVSSLTQLASCVTDAIRLQAALLTSEQLRKELHDFTYAISHDLKSPANTMNLLLKEIQEEELGDDGRFLIDCGIATSERMSQQIEDILAYTRAVEQKEQMELVDLNKLIDDIASDLTGALKSVDAVLKRDELPNVFGNRFQLKSLFQNLIENALKFRMPDRKPIVSITSSINTIKKYDEIGVTDNGIGIADEHQGKIFGLFSRLHVREEYPGTGIGLALCNRVCSNHKGTLSVSSQQGVGTVFTVTLPQKSS